MRPTYETPADLAAQAEIAEIYALYCERELVAFPRKAVADYVLLEGDRIVTLVEVKTVKKPWRYHPVWITGITKIKKLRMLTDYLKTTSIYVVRFSCGTVAAVDIAEDDGIREGWGRTDRGDEFDREDGVVFDYDRMLVIAGADAEFDPRPPAQRSGEIAKP